MTEKETITGEVVATREVEKADDEFRRAVQNRLSFRNLEGGVYKLVKVDDSDAETDASDK